MSNFAKKLKEATKKDLEEYIELDPNSAILASEELTRRELEKLNKTIQASTDQSSKHSKILILFTSVLILIGIFQLLILIAEPQGWWKLIWTIIIIIFLLVFYKLARLI